MWFLAILGLILSEAIALLRVLNRPAGIWGLYLIVLIPVPLIVGMIRKRLSLTGGKSDQINVDDHAYADRLYSRLVAVVSAAYAVIFFGILFLTGASGSDAISDRQFTFYAVVMVFITCIASSFLILKRIPK